MFYEGQVRMLPSLGVSLELGAAFHFERSFFGRLRRVQEKGRRGECRTSHPSFRHQLRCRLGRHPPDHGAAPGHLELAPLTLEEHLLIAIKSTIVSGSWLFAYLSLKVLPITIVAPIRASGPVWVLMGGALWLGQVPDALSLLAFFTTLGGYFWFTRHGAEEGIHWIKNPWVLCILAGTFLGVGSALFDAYLMQERHIHPMAVQLHFSIYMVPVQGAFLLLCRWLRPEQTPFQWRWSIPLVGITLFIVDAFYFFALVDETAYIALVSALRRGSLIIAFFWGGWWLKEKNMASKRKPVVMVMAGLAGLALASSI